MEFVCHSNMLHGKSGILLVVLTLVMSNVLFSASWKMSTIGNSIVYSRDPQKFVTYEIAAEVLDGVVYIVIQAASEIINLKPVPLHQLNLANRWLRGVCHGAPAHFIGTVSRFARRGILGP